MRRFAYLVGLLLLASVSANAQDNSKIDLFGGFSYVRLNPGLSTKGINLFGGAGSVAFNLNSWLAGVGEVAAVRNSSVFSSGQAGTIVTYMFGPKISLSSGKIVPFGQALFGGAHASTSLNTTSANAFAMALGGGLDWNAAPHFAIRLAQVEYFMTRFNTPIANHENNFRYSTGVVIRF